jgi:magnesium transporter
MDGDMQMLLISSFSDKELHDVFDELFVDDTVDIIEEMPASVAKRILQQTDANTRKIINQILAYPEDSAGSIMTVEYINLRPTMTVAETFAHIRRVGFDSETIYTCYVTESRKLIGVVSVLDLLLADPEKPVAEIMTTNVVSVPTIMDKEEVALLFSKYDFLALPVVDKQGLLVGIITVDDAFDVMSEADEEDISKMAAITPTDRPYLKTSAIEIWLNRIPWLLILMLSATFTGIIISSFENALATQVVLTAFIPMLMGTGGNAGSQASVTVIRGISLGEIEFRDLLAVIWKEIRVAVLCGATLAVATFGKLMLVDKFIMGGDITLMVALVVSVTQLLTVICAKIIGCLMPMLADKLHLDPAVMASPFITTIVDALSLLVYFAIASMLLGL